MNKDTKQLMQKIRKAGWTIRFTGKHALAVSPSGKHVVSLSLTPSDPRAIKNEVAQLRRTGEYGERR